MSFLFVYVTTPSIPEAKKIADAIVGERLAACANILPGMTSIYRWEGKIEEARETVLILKTRRDLFPAVEARVKALHSYQTPCIAALPVEAGHAAYLDWITSETRPA